MTTPKFVNFDGFVPKIIAPNGPGSALIAWDESADPTGDRAKVLRGDQTVPTSVVYAKLAGADPVAAQDFVTKVFAESNFAMLTKPSFGRDANASNIWLYGPDRIPGNEAPFRIPFDATIIFVSATTNGNETCTFEVYRNADVRAGGTPSVLNALAVLTFTAQQSGQASFSVNVNAGDELAIYLRGSGIQRPRSDIFLARRY